MEGGGGNCLGNCVSFKKKNKTILDVIWEIACLLKMPKRTHLTDILRRSPSSIGCSHHRDRDPVEGRNEKIVCSGNVL